MQRLERQETRTKRRESRTPAQEMEYKESESARRAELRERKKVEAAEAKLAEEVRENLDFIRSFVFEDEWTITATCDEISWDPIHDGFNGSRKYEDRIYSVGDRGTGILQWGSNVRLSFRDEVLFKSQNECVGAV